MFLEIGLVILDFDTPNLSLAIGIASMVPIYMSHSPLYIFIAKSKV